MKKEKEIEQGRGSESGHRPYSQDTPRMHRHRRTARHVGKTRHARRQPFLSMWPLTLPLPCPHHHRASGQAADTARHMLHAPFTHALCSQGPRSAVAVLPPCSTEMPKGHPDLHPSPLDEPSHLTLPYARYPDSVSRRKGALCPWASNQRVEREFKAELETRESTSALTSPPKAEGKTHRRSTSVGCRRGRLPVPGLRPVLPPAGEIDAAPRRPRP